MALQIGIETFGWFRGMLLAKNAEHQAFFHFPCQQRYGPADRRFTSDLIGHTDLSVEAARASIDRAL